ncbi:hypothetical protein [Nocardioides stalactiti]|uniref:hypothetical protein n=1 Tax=Nocardioides stalactiti TaxID=2755356 RepID=UPI0016047286|nr:hypothetical protein [Nocardioides stalactiti]
MDENQDPNEPVEPATPDAPADEAVTPGAAAPMDAPAAERAAFDSAPADTKPGWCDRTFRWRAVAAVALAGVILGATGGALTTALFAHDGRGDRGEHHRMEMPFQRGVPPMMPPGGRPGFPGGVPGDGNQDDTQS